MPITWPALTPPATPVLSINVPVPPATESVSRRSLPSLSTSAMRRPVTKTSVFSSVESGPGSVNVGASLIGLTVMVRVSVSTRAPPEPLLPLSSVRTVRVSAPLKSVFGR